jgi:4-hydroxythreonine-4-phosphate dehydrogenase
MNTQLPIIGITMGDPVGVGPEIILRALQDQAIYEICRPMVVGDRNVLEAAKTCTGSSLNINEIQDVNTGRYTPGWMDLLCISDSAPNSVEWGKPTAETGRAMIAYINTVIDMAMAGSIAGMVTGPINKAAMKMAGSRYAGHTELLADRTKTDDYVMMLAGDRLRVVLATIHIPYLQVPNVLTSESILKTIKITNRALTERFGLEKPNLAVAGLNPHAGEGGLFGDEEERVILPAIQQARDQGIAVTGPFPPDTVFVHAANGRFDAVVCMYHDQGLIPLKLLHFKDGVNTTLGLPIIRTSVDHGTAYDIAGTGQADPGSMIAAIQMAVEQAGGDWKLETLNPALTMCK